MITTIKNINTNENENKFIQWANFHTHCNFCHGKGSPEEYVEEAIKTNLCILGFSCHASLPFYTEWAMSKEKEKEYPIVINSLKKKYESKINIKLGLEIDYIRGIVGENMNDYNKLMDLDYSIGSIHYLGEYNSENLLPVDADEEYFTNGLQKLYGGNIKKVVEEYYLLLQEMVCKGGFNIVGHLDIIKKNNQNSKFYSEDEKWYKNIVEDTLLTILKKGLIVEANTGGMSRNYINSTYPSPWILERCLKLNIPVVLSSDAHLPSHITAFFSETAQIMQKLGFEYLYILGDEKWEPRHFTAKGLIL